MRSSILTPSRLLSIIADPINNKIIDKITHKALRSVDISTQLRIKPHVAIFHTSVLLSANIIYITNPDYKKESKKSPLYRSNISLIDKIRDAQYILQQLIDNNTLESQLKVA